MLRCPIDRRCGFVVSVIQPRSDRQTRMKSLELVLLVACSASVLDAQWLRTSGLFDGQICSVVRNGQYLFAGSDFDGVSRSSDSGAHWTLVNDGLTNKSVRSLIVSDSELFLATYSSVFHSIDNGNDWHPASLGLNDKDIYSLLADSTNLFVGTSDGVFRSSDKGNSWFATDSGLARMDSLVITGLSSATEGRITSVSVQTNLLTLSNPFVYLLANDGTTLFASTSFGVYYSTDEGDYWRELRTSIPLPSVSAFVFNDSAVVVGTQFGVYRLARRDTVWDVQRMGLPNTQISSMAFVDSILCVGTYDGAFRTLDGGAHWSSVNSGLTRVHIRTLVADGMTLFAGTDGGGIFRSTNGGTDWFAVNTCLKSSYVYALSHIDSVLIAGTYDGAYRSTDHGESWTDITRGMAGKKVLALAVKGGALYAGCDSGVYRSTESGGNWTRVNTGLRSFPQSFLVLDSDIFAGTGDGLFRSTNDGLNWTDITSGIYPYVMALATGPDGAGGTYIYAGTVEGGAYRSNNRGASWSAIDTSLTGFNVSTILASGMNIFTGSSYGGGVHVSTDYGVTWDSRNDGLTSTHVFAFALSGANLFVGTLSGGGVFRSTNNGISWANVSEGLDVIWINKLMVDTPYVFAATAYGVWRRPLSEVVAGVDDIQDAPVSHFTLFQNYPNPFNPTTEIRFSIPKFSFVNLRIFDLLGRKVATLVNDQCRAGTCSVKWDAHNLPSGVYFYQLRTGFFVETKKLLLMK
jgi:ligand-binding sensor domain-containing protein